MENLFENLLFFASFVFIALAARQLGQYFLRVKLPLISGFLFAGILAGPYMLDLISKPAVERLQFVDTLALAFIAFAAGSELSIDELKGRVKSIAWMTTGLVLVTYLLGATAVALLADFIPFMQTMNSAGRLAVALLAGAILVARSPSSAIAIVNELRARGPFTQMTLGVTVIMDVIVIMLFAINSEIADALLTSLGFNLTFVILLLIELALSIVIGILLGLLLQLILNLHSGGILKSILVLVSGYAIFEFSDVLRHLSHDQLPFEILLEPLLICMIAGFFVINRSCNRAEFLKILEESGLPIYVAFFTLTGASLALDILAATWPIALALFFVRLAAIYLGSFFGGVVAREPMKQNRISWMAFVTQAGVGLGLAKEVAVEFPDWGAAFATVMISVIVLNQIMGPPLFKWAIFHIGEAHPRVDVPDFSGSRDVFIFGLKAQSISLARQLAVHDWQVKLICVSPNDEEPVAMSGVAITYLDAIDKVQLDSLEMERADAMVAMLSSDEDNYGLCELVYEQYGTKTMVVRLEDRSKFDRFQKLGVQVVEPQTAVLSLLEHFVRSPAGTSLLLGMHDFQEIVDFELLNPRLHGKAVRDLRLPLDVLIMSVNRNGQMIISHGYTTLELGDRVTMVGPEDKLEEVMLRFEA